MKVDPRIRPWTRKDRRVYVFKNANIVNSNDGTVSVGTDVMISDGKIKAVSSTTINEPDVIEIDAEGMYLCPGLIDCHVHLSFTPGTSTVTSLFSSDARESYFRQPYVCSQMLKKGFTSVRDTAGATFALKEAIAEGVFPGPRLFISGKALSQTGGHGDFRARHEHDNCCGGRVSSQCLQLCDGVPECLKAARQELRIGADFIKIMAGGGVASPFDAIPDLQFTPEEIKAITTVAGNRNTYVTAHAYTPTAIKMAIENGVTCIEHGNNIDEETATLMAQNDVFLVPTLVTYSEMAETSWSDFLPSGMSEKNAEVLQDGLKSLLVAHKAGVVICFGTDLLGPLVAAQTKEFALRAQVLSAAEILKSATVSAAKLVRHEELLGQIKPGYFADLLVLNTNPLEDISVFDRPMEHLMAVIKDGRVEVSQWDRLPTDV
ncbi:hypothetical protein BO83DRAFT_421231 [Aspergillus eucalypticola CBS 122712]|uniref:Amidohydrolase-related domain-containing protein n=1 Tax=Aspergillus eucalypticola (strain CBS 122712 / IBT 29274) TaxID=1448314 RepID=A0A317URI3_ASPEC|nr:uncharacterized protein BO83DRAFT_421231 [Aspergillus eucalypticola CBS 122712]PWY63042.1 hypothetical protein BO83DRAFT_421231 [Aspergillus eucalypticola CBS 122712]